MKYLEKVLADFTERIKEIISIGDINEELVQIAVTNLKYLRDDLVASERNAGIIRKVDIQLLMYEQVAKIPELESSFPILRGQMVVLTVGAQEAFISEIFRTISNNEPQLLTWKDPKEMISFEPSLLSTGFSIGDTLIGHLKNKGYSFQDLKSSLDAVNKYLDCDFVVDADLKDELILAAAWRNVIVHNKSKIDHSFLKQVRDTRYADQYSLDEILEITEDDIQSLSGVVLLFAEALINKIQEKE